MDSDVTVEEELDKIIHRMALICHVRNKPKDDYLYCEPKLSKTKQKHTHMLDWPRACSRTYPYSSLLL